MNPSSMDPLQGANSTHQIHSSREAMKKTQSETVKSSKESRTQQLDHIKSQISNGTFTPDLQTLAIKMIQGKHLNG